MSKQMKNKILELRSQGKTYNQIQKELGCSKGTICYHCADGQKNKTKIRRRNWSKKHPYKRKLEIFSRVETPIIRPHIHKAKKIIQLKIEQFCRIDKMYQKPSFTEKDIIDKFGENPKCYITGEQIDIYEPRKYNFDHIIPRSRGGDNSLDNLGICTKQANASKSDMTPDELLQFCQKVLKHHGYKIEAPAAGIEPA